MATEKLIADVSPEFKALIKRLALDEGTSVKEIIIKAVNEYAERRGTK